ncbi:transposase [Bradyrhizobium pachyrhizi]|uniref:Transposase n=2 Tax=Bradyrhizobium pachyrhizi TaxID=280333 RepID=A0A844T3Q8_9BRAD|nr:transposase [Bradyrhizobium pachyrhizi]
MASATSLAFNSSREDRVVTSLDSPHRNCEPSGNVIAINDYCDCLRNLMAERPFKSGFEKPVHRNSRRVGESDSPVQRLSWSLPHRRAPMRLFVGSGIGLVETSLCIVDGEGLAVREVKVRLLKRKLIDFENNIRALRAYGLLVGAVARGALEARVRELIERSDPIFVMTIRAMSDVLRAILERYDRLHRVLLQVVQHDAGCRRLMTVLGVGPVATLSFNVGFDDSRRFARSRSVGAHFGLAPRPHQSGMSIDHEVRISKQGDVAVRESLCEAAASLLLRVRKRSALPAWGLWIAKRSSMLCAITAVARKLRAFCLGCGSVRPTSTSGSAPRSRNGCG